MQKYWKQDVWNMKWTHHPWDFLLQKHIWRTRLCLLINNWDALVYQFDFSFVSLEKLQNTWQVLYTFWKEQMQNSMKFLMYICVMLLWIYIVYKKSSLLSLCVHAFPTLVSFWEFVFFSDHTCSFSKNTQ